MTESTASSSSVRAGMNQTFSRFSKSVQKAKREDVLIPVGFVFGAILFGSAVGAMSFRRKAKEIAKKYPHRFEPPPNVAKNSKSESANKINYDQVRVRDVLTPREVFKLFALPGAISAVILGVVIKGVSVAAGVKSFKEAQHLLRWASGAAKPQNMS